MRKAVLGFLGGIAASFLAIWLLDAGTEDADLPPAPETAATGASSSALRAPDDTRTGQESADQSIQASAVGAETVVPMRNQETLPEQFASREAGLRAEIEETQQALEDLRAEMVAAELAADPIVSPVPLPPEFDWISDNAYRELFHERMQREPIDTAWAAETEAKLSSFIYGRPAVIQKYGPPTIRCHTTQCEVMFLAQGIYDDPSVAVADARSFFDDSFDEMDGLFDCGPGECWAEANSDDGVVTIFWAMTKDEQQLQDDSKIVTALR